MEEWIATSEGYVNRNDVKSFVVDGSMIFLVLKDGRKILKSSHKNSSTLNKEIEILEDLGLTEDYGL